MSQEKLLSSLGLNEETLKSISEENLADIEQKIIDNVKSKLLEKEEFYSSIDKARLPKEWFTEKFGEGVAKISTQSKNAIDKHFALTAEDKADFSEDEKKDVEKYVAKAASLYKAKINGKDKDINGLQDENLTLKKRLSELEEQQKSLSEKFESDLKEKLTAKEMETLSLIEASGLQQNVPISINLIWDKVYKNVNDKYNVVIENGKPTIRKKDNPTFKIENPEKKGEYLELKDALVAELKSFGAWKDAEEKKEDKQQRTTVTVTPSNQKYSDAMRKKIEEEERFFS